MRRGSPWYPPPSPPHPLITSHHKVAIQMDFRTVIHTSAALAVAAPGRVSARRHSSGYMYGFRKVTACMASEICRRDLPIGATPPVRYPGRRGIHRTAIAHAAYRDRAGACAPCRSARFRRMGRSLARTFSEATSACRPESKGLAHLDEFDGTSSTPDHRKLVSFT